MHVWMGYRFCDCFDVLTRAIVIFMYQLKVHQKIAVSLLSAKWKFNGVPLIIIEDLSFLKWVFITSLVKFWYNRIWVIRTTYILRDWVEVHETELRFMRLSWGTCCQGWRNWSAGNPKLNFPLSMDDKEALLLSVRSLIRMPPYMPHIFDLSPQ